MPARERFPRWPAAVAAASAASLGWALWITTTSTAALIAAIGAHLVGALVSAWAVGPERKGLALALGIAVPAVGPLAALAATVRGRGGDELLHDPHARARTIDGRELARCLAGARPSWEAVVSLDVDTRRAALAHMARRASAADLEVLRWARARCGGDLALEVALALDEAAERYEERVARARAVAADDRSYGAAAHAFRVLLDGIHSGLVDPPAIARVAEEARAYHEAAIAADGARARELRIGRAQLELADRQPAAALQVLEPALEGLAADTGDAERALYQQAAYAARRFDLALGAAPERLALAG